MAAGGKLRKARKRGQHGETAEKARNHGTAWERGGLGVKSMLIKQSASRSLDLVPMALKWAVMHEVINEQSYRYIISPKVCRWLLVLKS